LIYPEFTIPKQTSSTPIDYGKELAFNFDLEEFVMEDGRPKVVDGKAALEVWIHKALLTARYRFRAYTDAYGSELDVLIGASVPTPILEMEVQRVIREALIYDNRINDIRDFKIGRDGSFLNVEFTVITFDDDTLLQEVRL